MGDGLGHTDREAISNTDAVSAPEQQADGSDNTGSASEQGNTEGASSVSSIAAGPSVVEGTHNGGDLSGEEEHATKESTSQFPHGGDNNFEAPLSSNCRCCSPEDEDSSCPPKKLCFERSPGSGRNNPSENMGDGLGHTDREAISNTDAVSAPEQQADGSDNTGSASEQGNTEGASSVSSIAAGPSVVEGTHNGGAPSGEEEHATQESTSQFPHGGDNNTAAPLSSCRRCRSPEDEDSSCPPKKPCFERSPGSGSGVRNAQAGISLHDNAAEASLQPSVAEGCVQASLNDNTPPPLEIINDPGVDGNGSNLYLENTAQGMPPLLEYGVEFHDGVEQEQGDLEAPEPEFYSFTEDAYNGDSEDESDLFHTAHGIPPLHEIGIEFCNGVEQEQGDLETPEPEFYSFTEDAIMVTDLFLGNEFVHLPFGHNFRI
ncbi:uncharacterized protein LOC135214292 isoform X2 [Macrobrachium nipponense]|uniref:uncharacterized protein LOC135214292 isoform X2 n=1 Tax=Macrobrachium nipponense TaxID=159736 RepID=UPI0030C819DD